MSLICWNALFVMYAVDGEHGGSFSVGLPLNGLGKKMQKNHFWVYNSLSDQSEALCDRSDIEHVLVNCSRALSDQSDLRVNTVTELGNFEHLQCLIHSLDFYM